MRGWTSGRTKSDFLSRVRRVANWTAPRSLGSSRTSLLQAGLPPEKRHPSLPQALVRFCDGCGQPLADHDSERAGTSFRRLHRHLRPALAANKWITPSKQPCSNSSETRSPIPPLTDPAPCRVCRTFWASTRTHRTTKMMRCSRIGVCKLFVCGIAQKAKFREVMRFGVWSLL